MFLNSYQLKLFSSWTPLPHLPPTIHPVSLGRLRNVRDHPSYPFPSIQRTNREVLRLVARYPLSMSLTQSRVLFLLETFNVTGHLTHKSTSSPKEVWSTRVCGPTGERSPVVSSSRRSMYGKFQKKRRFSLTDQLTNWRLLQGFFPLNLNLTLFGVLNHVTSPRPGRESTSCHNPTLPLLHNPRCWPSLVYKYRSRFKTTVFTPKHTTTYTSE